MSVPRLLLVLLLSSCSSVPAPPPLQPTPTCTDVCAHGGALGCPFALSTDGGASCVEVCENVQRSGIIEWDLTCRASASSCGAIDRCEDR